MANIVWSFGIALEAEDRTEAPIDAFSDRLSALNKRIEELESQTRTSIDAAASLSRAEEGVGKSVRSVGDSVDKTKALFGSFEITVASVVEESIKLMGKFAKFAFNAPMEIVKGLVNLLQSIPDTISNWVFGKSITELASGLRDAANATERFLDLGGAFAPIDKAVRQLTAQIGGTRAQATSLLDNIVKIGITSGFSIGNVSDLAVSLGEAGHSMGSFTEDQVRVMNHLASTFGLGASETVRFNSAVERLNLDIKQLAGTAAVFGSKFGIPNLMQILPELTNMAADSVSRFSKNVVFDQRQIIESTLRTSTIYAKAFGKDIREAAGMAEATFAGFTAAAQQNADLMLGLADTMSPLGKALLQGGADWQSMGRILREGQENPIVAATSIRRLIESMRPGPYQDRFVRLLQKELPEGVKQLVFEQKAFDRAIRANEMSQGIMTEAVVEGTRRFDEMADAMRDNFTTMRDVLGNIGTAIKGLFGELFTDTFTSSIKNATTYITALGTKLGGLVAQARNSREFIALQGAFQKVAGVLLAAGSALDIFAEGLFSLSTITGILTPITAALNSFTSLVQNSFKAGEFSIGAFVHGLVKGVGAVKLFGSTSKDVLGGFADYFDTFFFGLPTEIARAFSSGADKEKITFRTAISSLFSSAKDVIRDILDDWNRSIPKNLSSMFHDAGESIGDELGNIVRTVTGFVRSLFNKEDREEVMGNFIAMFKTTEEDEASITESILGIAGKALDAAKEFLTGFFDGFLGHYGTNTELFVRGLKNRFTDFSISIGESFNAVKGTLTTFYNTVLPLFQGLGSIMASTSKGIISIVETMAELPHTLERIAIKFLEIKQSLPQVLGGGLDAGEQVALAALRGAQSERQKGYEAAKKSIDDINAGLKALNKIETTGGKSDLEEKRKALKEEQDQYAKDVIGFKAAQFDKEMDQAKKQFSAKMRLSSEQSLALDDKKKSATTGPIGSFNRVEATSGENIRAKYDEVYRNTSPNFAQIWIMRWEADHFDPSRMPPIPSAESFRGSKGGTPAAPPPLPTSPVSAADLQKVPAVASASVANRVTLPAPVSSAQSTEMLVKAIVDAIRELADDITPDDQNIMVSVDRTGMEFGIKAIIDKMHARGGV